ncbi:MAG: AAA family ATPase [Lachnospiraceae bacterium]|nr:AAA family ATPase [Lachnospiraceae bacterium]
MSNRDDRIKELKEIIANLPQGNITYKTIRGAKRMYLNGRYVRAANEVETLELIDRRKRAENELRTLLLDEENTGRDILNSIQRYETNVITGERLSDMVSGVGRYKTRECFGRLKRFLDSNIYGKVCLLYGLRRTGKTIMLFQAISCLQIEKCAYIKIMTSDDMAMLNRDLRTLSDSGYKYVFIDEITLMTDFIDSASLLSDVYAMGGMKIVLSGTDSLGFIFSSDEELYDRTVSIHTTFIPFREYATLLGIHDIDEYIRYGGTFRVGETDLDDEELSDEGISFRDDETTRRYIDTAIARNIQHSLACYKDGSHFRHLIDLYEANEFTNAVNRIIEDMNHRFLISVITRDFKSHDLGSASQIDRKRSALKGATSILDQVDKQNVVNKLMDILDIKNKNELSVEITRDHVVEIKEYLKMLDLIINCPIESIGMEPSEGVIFTQPGMRYCQAQALVYALMKDDSFRQYSSHDRALVTNTILEEVRGRMLEEIVLLETKKCMPAEKRVFKLVFPVGEFDMVIADEKSLTCEIFEVKHTDKIYEAQYKNLIDNEKCAATEHEYGTITKKTVLYQGENTVIDGIEYRNVAGYLEEL